MRRPAAIAGSALFFLAAPAVVAGLVPRGVLWRYAAAVGAAMVAFVRLVEEPMLSRRHGTEYEEYRRAVRAWLPRLRPWKPGGRG